MPRWVVWLPLVVVACGPTEVHVRVAIPGADSALSPVPELPFVALPYDRDSVIAALEAQAPTPAPNTAALDSLFRAYRGPFSAYARTSLRVSRLQDSLSTIRAELDSIPRSASAYRSLYALFTDMADSLTKAQAANAKAESALRQARQALGPRMEALRAARHQWEDSTYRGYDSITTALAKSRGLAPVADTTGPDGRATLRLLPGHWWIYARSWDAEDPNAEWYWNLPVAGDSIVLDPTTGTRRTRY